MGPLGVVWLASSLILMLIVLTQPKISWLMRLALLPVIIIGIGMLPDGWAWRRFQPLGVMALALVMLAVAWSSWK